MNSLNTVILLLFNLELSSTISWAPLDHLLILLSLLDHLLTFYRPSRDLLLTISWPSLDLLLTISWPFLDLLLTFSWPSLDLLLTFSWPSLDLLLTISWSFSYPSFDLPLDPSNGLYLKPSLQLSLYPFLKLILILFFNFSCLFSWPSLHHILTIARLFFGNFRNLGNLYHLLNNFIYNPSDYISKSLKPSALKLFTVSNEILRRLVKPQKLIKASKTLFSSLYRQGKGRNRVMVH